MKMQANIYQPIIPTTERPNDADVPKMYKKQYFFYYFCYVGHVILALKINEIRPNIL